MIQIEQTPAFKRYVLEKSLTRQVRQMATYLMTALFIEPHGRQLASVITPNVAQDNTELVLDWVRQEVCCVSCCKEFDFTELQRSFVSWLLNHDVPMGELQ